MKMLQINRFGNCIFFTVILIFPIKINGQPQPQPQQHLSSGIPGQVQSQQSQVKPLPGGPNNRWTNPSAYYRQLLLQRQQQQQQQKQVQQTSQNLRGGGSPAVAAATPTLVNQNKQQLGHYSNIVQRAMQSMSDLSSMPSGGGGLASSSYSLKGAGKAAVIFERVIVLNGGLQAPSNATITPVQQQGKNSQGTGASLSAWRRPGQSNPKAGQQENSPKQQTGQQHQSGRMGMSPAQIKSFAARIQRRRQQNQLRQPRKKFASQQFNRINNNNMQG